VVGTLPPQAERRALIVRPVSLTITDRDTHRVFTYTAAAGIVATVVLALVGLPAANLHGPLHFQGVMDPLCGMTRGMFYAGQGEWLTAWRYNPGSLLLLTGAAVAVLRAAVGSVTARWLQVRIAKPLLYSTLIVAIVVLEINQQAHAALLMRS